MPAIDTVGLSGNTHGIASGDLEVVNCTFKYPSRPDQVILNEYNLKVCWLCGYYKRTYMCRPLEFCWSEFRKKCEAPARMQGVF